MTPPVAMSEARLFAFRPWVGRAGLSIVLVAAAATLGIAWIGEPAMWAYIATLWIGGLKVWLGTWRPVAEVDRDRLILRPLHNVRQRSIRWPDISGTEQMIGGDRLIVYYDTPRGMRFVALNLNLVKGRRDFLALIEERLRSMGFAERMVERSRYLSRERKEGDEEPRPVAVDVRAERDGDRRASPAPRHPDP